MEDKGKSAKPRGAKRVRGVLRSDDLAPIKRRFAQKKREAQRRKARKTAAAKAAPAKPAKKTLNKNQIFERRLALIRKNKFTLNGRSYDELSSGLKLDAKLLLTQRILEANKIKEASTSSAKAKRNKKVKNKLKWKKYWSIRTLQGGHFGLGKSRRH